MSFKRDIRYRVAYAKLGLREILLVLFDVVSSTSIPTIPPNNLAIMCSLRQIGKDLGTCSNAAGPHFASNFGFHLCSSCSDYFIC